MTVPKLAVCWIWGSPFVWTRSVETMLRLSRPAGVEVDFFRGSGSLPARRHMDACEKAYAWGAGYFLILGADQTYQPDLLLRLWARMQEGYDVMAAPVPSRGYYAWHDMKPFQAMAWKLKSNGMDAIKWGRRAYDTVKMEGDKPLRIDFCGSGVLMFRREHLDMLEQPWFYETIDYKTQNRTASMDTKFVYRLHDEAYAQVWMDPTIKVKHINPDEIDDTWPDRFADYAIPGVGPADICQHGPSPDRPHLTLTTAMPRTAVA